MRFLAAVEIASISMFHKKRLRFSLEITMDEKISESKTNHLLLPLLLLSQSSSRHLNTFKLKITSHILKLEFVSALYKNLKPCMGKLWFCLISSTPS
jgi:hypothetical protein